jgi:hypothetical protein
MMAGEAAGSRHSAIEISERILLKVDGKPARDQKKW